MFGLGSSAITVKGVRYLLSLHDGLNSTSVYIYLDNDNPLPVAAAHINDETETARGETPNDQNIEMSYHEFADIDLQHRGVAIARKLCKTLKYHRKLHQ